MIPEFVKNTVKLIEHTIDGAKVTILDDDMKRSQPDEFNHLGIIGVNIQIDWDLFGIKKYFLGCQISEDIIFLQTHNGTGYQIIENIVYELYRKEMEYHINNFKNENINNSKIS